MPRLLTSPMLRSPSQSLYPATTIIQTPTARLLQVDDCSSDWLLHPHHKQAVLWGPHPLPQGPRCAKYAGNCLVLSIFFNWSRWSRSSSPTASWKRLTPWQWRTVLLKTTTTCTTAVLVLALAGLTSNMCSTAIISGCLLSSCFRRPSAIFHGGKLWFALVLKLWTPSGISGKRPKAERFESYWQGSHRIPLPRRQLITRCFKYIW